MSVLCHLFPVTKIVLRPLVISSPHLNSMWVLGSVLGSLIQQQLLPQSPAGAGEAALRRGAVARPARVLRGKWSLHGK